MTLRRTSFLAGPALAALLAAAPSVQAAEFKFAGPLDAYTLDPHAISNTLVFAVLRNVYEPLVTRGKDLSIEPALATDWKQVEDTVWEFKLREDVKFSNGNDFTADDVVFSFERAKKGGMKSHLSEVESIEKVDDHTVRLKTKSVDPILPKQIVNWFMMDSDWAAENGATEPGQADNSTESYANRNAMGTGSYVISDRDPGVKTVFSANPDWWGKMDGNVDKATFFVIANPSTRVSALISGEVDMIDGVPPQDASRIESTDGLRIEATSDLRTVYMQPDVARDELIHGGGVKGNPFKDPKVRQAMKLAIDTEAIQKRIMRGYSTPVGLPIANEVEGSTSELNAPNKPDLEKAKQLMKEAGYEDGFDVTLDCTNDRFMNDEATCLAVGSFLAQIGIRITPRAQATARWAQQINPPGYNTSFTMLSYSPYTYDAHQFLSGLAATRDPANGRGVFNIGGYSDPRIDKLTDEIGSERDPEKRTKLLQEAFSILKASDAYIPIHQLQILWGVRKGVDVVQQADLAYPLRWFQVSK
ncbi:ABC transporter substrate-binding protein [Aurantimonas sp. VKM B-3413]|uniref:ABC transporter substrate-binding protein n=1 Tax=Aurantimonas sp. VKM B-3413 TaxID=2779401 RepID=UPI001E5EEE7A|nr:ABC transporter substrate-binding protein [Aurantimonas sp. VKM B-3413]MCB8836221.1 ABC transporter substrate-binding protein [Aurantimonas sp. VKM B-3413]